MALCGSRFCSPAESRYSPIKGELLAVTWALKKTRIFTLGAAYLYIIRDVWYRSGPDNVGPDALSCRPIGINLMTEHKVIQISTKQMQQETACDRTIQLVLSFVRTGFPATRSQLHPDTRSFWNARAHLREKDGMLFFDNHIVIPKRYSHRDR